MRSLAGIAAVALIMAEMTAAIPPPPPLKTIARYGPLTHCANGYQILVGADQAIVLNFFIGRDEIKIVGRHQQIYVTAGPFSQPESARHGRVRVAGLGFVDRFSQDGGITYVLRALGNNLPMQLDSDRFDGTERDLIVIRQFVRMGEMDRKCREFGPPDYHGDDAKAADWSPFRIAAKPQLHCFDKIGLTVLPGESFRFMWQIDSIGELRSHKKIFRISGPAPGETYPTRDMAADYVRKIEADPPGWYLGIIPRGRISSDPNNIVNDSLISISSETASKGELEAIARRLKFVGTNDRRCS